MCFWFGLETLRIVHKKAFLLKYWMVFTLFDLLSCRKISTAPYKSWKNFFWNSLQRVLKEAQFCTDFKKGAKLLC
jgi:hypothetical protein